MSASGTEWEMYVEGNVVVAAFTDRAAFEEIEQIERSFHELIQRPAVTAHVAHMDLDNPPGNKMLDGAADAADLGVEHGLEKWAAVADGIERMAVKKRVDRPELDVIKEAAFEAAMEWARD